MNYSNLPVYIRKSIGGASPPFANVYDPTGADNSLYMVNLDTEKNISLQYFSSPATRVTGNGLNYEELFAPKLIKANNPITEAKIYLPKFRSLVFYNLDGSRMKDPAYPADDLPPLYFSGYSGVEPYVDYVNHNKTDYYLRLRWSGAFDNYSLEYWPTGGGSIPQTQLIYSSGTGFSSGWNLFAGDTYTGVFCSGFGATAEDVKNAINTPSGQSYYYTDGTNNDFNIKNTTSGSAALSETLSAKLVNTATGYVAPHNLLNLGKAYHYLPAQNISVEYSAQNDPLRRLGVDVDQEEQFTHSAALQAKISFNSYVNTELSGGLGAVLESSGDNVYDIRFGNNVYNKCYLGDYKINVEPFKPVVLAANYIVNEAPILNSNDQSHITATIEGSTNYLLDSESMTGANYIYTNLATYGLNTDPTGGSKATLISGQSNTIDTYSYSVYNTGAYSWATISGSVGATNLTDLKTNADLSVGISFTGGKVFQMGDDTAYTGIWISNNGIMSFDSLAVGYSNYQNQEFPIPSATKKFIAPYWRDMFASIGQIWYEQSEDTFTIEYAAVNALSGSQPQTYQVILTFSTNRIEIIYKTITPSGAINPNANVGIQWSTIDYINYGLSYVDITKKITFERMVNSTTVGPNFIHKNKIAPNAQRSFSVYLKREGGVGDIKYTLNSGIKWTSVDPSLTSEWQRYLFPSDSESQQVGIQVAASGDTIYVYGGQLEPLPYMTDYIPTSGIAASRASSSYDIEASIVSPTVSFSTGFANSMIAGHTSSVSSTTGFISNIQNSISYSVNCGRTPSYELGSINADHFFLDSVEKQMDISSTDLEAFINYSGTKLSANLDLILKDAKNITGASVSMKSGANIYSQQSSLQEGDILMTQVSIKEIVI